MPRGVDPEDTAGYHPTSGSDIRSPSVVLRSSLQHVMDIATSEGTNRTLQRPAHRESDARITPAVKETSFGAVGLKRRSTKDLVVGKCSRSVSPKGLGAAQGASHPTARAAVAVAEDEEKQDSFHTPDIPANIVVEDRRFAQRSRAKPAPVGSLPFAPICH
ncbi:hypothetical protein MTO96_018910 [Rhipicephalus appendiculatus]